LLNQHRQAVIGTLLGQQAGGERRSRRAGLDPARPGLELQGLAIAPIRRFSLRLGKVWAHLDFWRSLNELTGVWPVDPERRQHRAGSGPACGTPSAASDQQEALLRFLLTQLSTFDIHDTRLSLTTALGEVRALDIAQLRWQNRGKRHQGVGKAYLINGVGESTLDLIIDGCPQVRLDRLKGQLYLGARQLDISPMLAGRHAGEPGERPARLPALERVRGRLS
jgi:uncharacterized protein YhdP